MRIMKRIIPVLCLSLVLAACSGVKNSDVVNNNEFTIFSDDARWSDGTVTFAPEGGEIVLAIEHDVTSVAWKVRCALDDAWCGYKQDADLLRITASANAGKEARTTHCDVIIGEHSRRVTIRQDVNIQPPHETEPSELPDTEWDNEDTPWQ